MRVNPKTPRVLCCGETSTTPSVRASARGSVNVPVVQVSTAFVFGPCFQLARVILSF